MKITYFLIFLISLQQISTFSVVNSQEYNRNIIDEIINQNTQIKASDRTAKYCKMADSPFMFYRGTNHLFWMDFVGDERLQKFSNSNTKIWIQGDLHTDNFGSFHTNQGKIIYNLNDFDEAIIADYQYDLWRFAISLVLVADQNKIKSQSTEKIINQFIDSYLHTLTQIKDQKQTSIVEFTANNTQPLLSKFLKTIEDKNSRKKLLKKWTQKTNQGQQFIQDNHRLETITLDQKQQLQTAMVNYGKTLTSNFKYSPEHFYIKDAARRILAGTGSLGTPRYYLLVEGETKSPKDDIILDIKLQSKPTAYQYFSDNEIQQYNILFKNDAQRYKIGQLALIGTVDNYLGWLELNNGYYSVRELSPYKESFPTDKLTKTKNMIEMAEQWGEILAHSHTRTYKNLDPGFIPNSLATEVTKLTKNRQQEFRQLLRSIAIEYSDQVESDWKTFIKTQPDC